MAESSRDEVAQLRIVQYGELARRFVDAARMTDEACTAIRKVLATLIWT
jgi:hypothetical protein